MNCRKDFHSAMRFLAVKTKSVYPSSLASLPEFAPDRMRAEECKPFELLIRMFSVTSLMSDKGIWLIVALAAGVLVHSPSYDYLPYLQ